MDVKQKPEKPLGHKSYGSIPHLPGSRLGEGDHHCHEGQAKIATERVRDKHDKVIVQEKLDGSNVGVAKVNNKILALTRSGYLASTSPYIQHHYFATWVGINSARFSELLDEGERACGEWLAQAHGTRYILPHEPFVVFDIMRGKDRIIFDDLRTRTAAVELVTPQVLGYGPMSISEALEKIGYGGKIWHSPHGAVEPIEGAIWRVERKGKVDFLTKFVHHAKQDGRYLPEVNGTGLPIWNIDITPFL